MNPCIWLNEGEAMARARCGCVLVREWAGSPDPALIRCAAHRQTDAAPTTKRKRRPGKIDRETRLEILLGQAEARNEAHDLLRVVVGRILESGSMSVADRPALADALERANAGAGVEPERRTRLPRDESGCDECTRLGDGVDGDSYLAAAARYALHVLAYHQPIAPEGSRERQAIEAIEAAFDRAQQHKESSNGKA